MAEYIGNSLGVTPNIEIKPIRKGEITRYIANIGKARALLNYTPKTPLEEGIPKAVEWSINWWEAHGEA
jgi:nucleoside-diphosphate-sugar epimerase